MKLFNLALCVLFLQPSLSFAQAKPQLKDENLMQSIPQGYKIAFQNQQNSVSMMEFIPKEQSLDNWQRMITTTIYLGMKGMTLQNLRDRMGSSWKAACAGSQIVDINTSKENNYDVTVWMQTCPLNKTTNKPENTIFKAIKGNDSVYLVQSAFKYQPSNEELKEALTYLHKIYVCDTRLASSPCA